LQDKSWNAVAEVEMPDDVPELFLRDGYFFYDERVEQYVAPTIYVVPSEFPPQSEIKSPWSPEFCESDRLRALVWWIGAKRRRQAPREHQVAELSIS
jgi:hypothetical protein